MKFFKALLFLLVTLFGQLNVKGQIINRTGYIYSELSAKINNMPGDSGNHYTQPNTLQLSTWQNTLNNLLLGNFQSASDSANSIGYQLVNFTDTFDNPSVNYYLLETIDSNYWGTYVFNPNYCRPLVIQAPHPKKDANTGKQGIHVFRKTKALFYQVAGTHRCNSNILSTCSGTTTGCSTNSQAYPISDLAHNVQSIFQKTTEVLTNQFTNTYFIQLHGFTKSSTDPYVILSNGTNQTSVPDFMVPLRNNLYKEDSVLTFKVAHVNLAWTRLRGFWNTQSRLVNNSSNPCNTSATSTNGRFFHIEQERIRLRSNVTGWNKMANALNNTFTCVPVSIQKQTVKSSFSIYPNPNQGMFIIKIDEILNKTPLLIYNQLGKLIKELALHQGENHFNFSDLSTGIYLMKYNGIHKKIIIHRE